MLLLIHYYLIKYKSLKYLNISKWMEITIIVIKSKKFHVIRTKKSLKKWKIGYDKKKKLIININIKYILFIFSKHT